MKSSLTSSFSTSTPNPTIRPKSTKSARQAQKQANYSILLLAHQDQIIPFAPREWQPTSTTSDPNQQIWTSVPETPPDLNEQIARDAIVCFRENQCQHGTNVVVRVDLQQQQHTNSNISSEPATFTSTSITRLPTPGDNGRYHRPGAQTRALVEATVPDGQVGLARLIASLKPTKLNPPQLTEREITENTQDAVDEASASRQSTVRAKQVLNQRQIVQNHTDFNLAAIKHGFMDGQLPASNRVPISL